MIRALTFSYAHNGCKVMHYAYVCIAHTYDTYHRKMHYLSICFKGDMLSADHYLIARLARTR